MSMQFERFQGNSNASKVLIVDKFSIGAAVRFSAHFLTISTSMLSMIKYNCCIEWAVQCFLQLCSTQLSTTIFSLSYISIITKNVSISLNIGRFFFKRKNSVSFFFIGLDLKY